MVSLDGWGEGQSRPGYARGPLALIGAFISWMGSAGALTALGKRRSE